MHLHSAHHAEGSRHVAGTTTLQLLMQLTGYGILPWPANGSAVVQAALLDTVQPSREHPVVCVLHLAWILQQLARLWHPSVMCPGIPPAAVPLADELGLAQAHMHRASRDE